MNKVVSDMFAAGVTFGMDAMVNHPEIAEFNWSEYILTDAEWAERQVSIIEVRKKDLRCIRELLFRMCSTRWKLDDTDLVTVLVYFRMAIDCVKHRFDLVRLREDLKLPELFEKNM